MKRVLLALALLVGASCMYASSDKEMDRFVSSLMKKMTLREKLGQLNLQPGSDATTGGAMKTEFGQLVADGEMGAVLNVMGKDKIRSIQRMAVEESRLGIPILFGLDVIHGYHTIFPHPPGTVVQLGHRSHRARSAHRSRRVHHRRYQLDLQPYGGYRARRPLGPHSRGKR